jgi:hypothetical protein
VELQFHKAANAMVQFYGNVSRILEDSILDVRVCDRLADEVASSDTEHDVGFRKHLKTIENIQTIYK